MEQTSLGSLGAIMKLAFTVKWFSILMFSSSNFYFGTIPPPSRSPGPQRANIRTQSAHWMSLRALLRMAGAFSQTCEECMRVCASYNGAWERTVRACMPVRACTVTVSVSQINRGRFIVPKLIVFWMHAFFPSLPLLLSIYIHGAHTEKPWHGQQALLLALTWNTVIRVE